MITIPSTEDRSEPTEFVAEDWEPSREAAKREVEKLKRLITKEMKVKPIDITTAEGIAEAEADLADFESRMGSFATAGILPWSMIVGRRRLEIKAAREALAKAV